MLVDWPFTEALLGGWLAVVLVFGVFNILQAWTLREPWRVTLGVLALTIVTTDAFFLGLFPVPSVELQQQLAPYVASISVALVTVLASRFSRPFLDFANLIPEHDRWLGRMEILVLSPLVLLLVLPPDWVAMLQIVIAFVDAIFWTAAFREAYRRGDYGAFLMAVGWPFAAIAGIVWFARNLGIIDDSALVTLVFVVGISVEGVLMSLALTYRLQKLAEDRFEALFEAREANRMGSELQAQLREEVAERTRELREEARRADEEYRSKQVFLSLISHDLRGPLSSISQAVSGLLDAFRRQDYRGFEPLLKRVNDSLDEQLALVDRLLDIEALRVGDGKYPAPSELNLRDRLDQRLRVWLPRFEAQGLRLENRIEADARLAIDPMLLETVLDNLLANALKHGPKGSAVWVEQAFGNTGGVVVGNHFERMSESARRQILDRSQGVPALAGCDGPEQASPVAGRDDGLGSGRGLGLWLAREVMRSRGGDLLGEIKGDRVLFELCAPAVSPRVLIVDDQPAQIQHLTERLVEVRPAIQVIPAESVESALQVLTNGMVELIISDVRMPGRDGFDFLSVVRATPQWDSTPFVMLSATGSEEEALALQRQAAMAGADAFYPKPLLSQDLEATLAFANL